MSIKKYMIELVGWTVFSAAVAAPAVAMLHYSFKKLNEMPVKVDRD